MSFFNNDIYIIHYFHGHIILHKLLKQILHSNVSYQKNSKLQKNDMGTGKWKLFQ